MTRRAYTLLNVVTSLAITSILVGGAVINVRRQNVAAQEDQLRRDLVVVRQAVEQFRWDNELWPESLADLAVTAAPATGRNPNGSSMALDGRNWRGPYLRPVPNDAVSRLPFNYVHGPSGYVGSSASGNDSRGTPYATY